MQRVKTPEPWVRYRKNWVRSGFVLGSFGVSLARFLRESVSVFNNLMDSFLHFFVFCRAANGPCRRRANSVHNGPYVDHYAGRRRGWRSISLILLGNFVVIMKTSWIRSPWSERAVPSFPSVAMQ